MLKADAAAVVAASIAGDRGAVHGMTESAHVIRHRFELRTGVPRAMYKDVGVSHHGVCVALRSSLGHAPRR